MHRHVSPHAYVRSLDHGGRPMERSVGRYLQSDESRVKRDWSLGSRVRDHKLALDNPFDSEREVREKNSEF